MGSSPTQYLTLIYSSRMSLLWVMDSGEQKHVNIWKLYCLEKDEQFDLAQKTEYLLPNSSRMSVLSPWSWTLANKGFSMFGNYTVFRGIDSSTLVELPNSNSATKIHLRKNRWMFPFVGILQYWFSQTSQRQQVTFDLEYSSMIRIFLCLSAYLKYIHSFPDKNLSINVATKAGH